MLLHALKLSPCKSFLLCSFPDTTLLCRRSAIHAAHRTYTSLGSSSSIKAVAKSIPISPYQIYISRSNDPFTNLSIEHYLLQKSHRSSTVLFLYINRPCVVIGRNQNPWLEANLSLLNSPVKLSSWDPKSGLITDASPDVAVDLVRRRSGGGTVFHDFGNVNYCVICPPGRFSRDKHAEMVVRAIRRGGQMRARVNERHDIVLDQGDGPSLASSTSSVATSCGPYDDDNDTHHWRETKDLHSTPFSDPAVTPLKVSGSAYKLTKNRALHHGTCLVNCPNVGGISKLLRSPAAAFIKARGVDSVRSPVGNVVTSYDGEAVGRFVKSAVEEFCEMYSIGQGTARQAFETHDERTGRFVTEGGASMGYVDDEMGEIEEVAKGIEEMKSPAWMYGQTPQFTFSSHPFEGDDRPRPPLPGPVSDSKVFLRARYGQIEGARITLSSDARSAEREAEVLATVLQGRKLHEIDDFSSLLVPADVHEDAGQLGEWLNGMLGKGLAKGE